MKWSREVGLLISRCSFLALLLPIIFPVLRAHPTHCQSLVGFRLARCSSLLFGGISPTLRPTRCRVVSPHSLASSPVASETN